MPETASKVGRPPIKADWDAIRQWCEAGNTYQGAAFQFGVKVTTIRSRAKREGWQTPTRTQREMSHLQQVVYELTGETEITKPEVSAHETLVAALCHRGLELFADAAPVPRTWKEADLLDRMARRALGIEKPQLAVTPLINVEVLNNPGLVQEVAKEERVVDVE